MVLVDYASSSEGESLTKEKNVNAKRKRDPSPGADAARPAPSLPALPAKFHDLYTAAARVSTSDDPSLHGGRIRAEPHVEGNWPTHIYLEWLPSAKEAELLTNVIEKYKNPHGNNSETKSSIHSFLVSQLGSPLPLHISLSKPLVLRTEVKDEVVGALQSVLGSLSVTAFLVSIDRITWVSNDEETRWFLVLKLKSNDSLTKLLDAINGRLGKWELALLYDGASGGFFHISVGWSLERPPPSSSAKDDAVLSQLSQVLASKCNRSLQISFDAVKIKVGNEVTSISLAQSFKQDQSLLGL